MLVWIGNGSPRLPTHVRTKILDVDTPLFVSAVTAWEFADLEHRSRLPEGVALGSIIDRLDATLLDYPAEAWTLARTLPKLHLDPVDRMLVAHAIHAGQVLCTADREMRGYPVECFW